MAEPRNTSSTNDCPEGYSWNPITKECEKIKARKGDCPEGYVWDYESQSCVENTPEYKEAGILKVIPTLSRKNSGYSKEDVEFLAKSKGSYTQKVKDLINQFFPESDNKNNTEEDTEDVPVQRTSPPPLTKDTEVKQPTTTETVAPAKQLTEDEKKEQEKKQQLRNQRVSEYNKEVEELKNHPTISKSSRFESILYNKKKELQDKLNSEFPPVELGVSEREFMDYGRESKQQPTVTQSQETTKQAPEKAQTPPPPPIIPPSTPQGQVEFMQKQAEQVPASAPVMPKPKQSIPQTPVPNETTSKVPLPPLVNVGTLGSEPLPSTPQATPKTIQGGLGTQGFPQQALAIQEEAPSVSGGVSGNRQNEMMAIADNVEPGVYTDPNAIKAQDVAAKTVANQQGVNSTPVTQPNTQAVQQPKQKMSVLGKLKSLFGFNEENQNDISSFEDAGMTLDGTTGTETGTISDSVNGVQNFQFDPNNPPATTFDSGLTQNTNQTGTQTGTQTIGTQTTGGEIGVANTRGGGTAPPPGSTPGIVGGGVINLGAGSEFVRVMPGQVVETTDKKGVKSKSIEDLIEIGGSGFDDDVYARKLRRQAAMPDLKNEDYYPNQPFSESRTAWGDPIFSGAGAQFPMAAYDAQRKARAQAELDEAKSNIMQLKIPEIKTGAYIQRFRGDFTNEITSVVNEAVKQAGGNRQIAMRNLKQSGKLAEIENKYNGIAKSIDQTADRAKDFLKNAQEKSTTMYFSPEGVRAATNFMNGAGAYADGLISGEDLNKLEQQFITADKWEKFKQENMGKLKPTDYIPTPEQLKNYTPEDQKVFEAVKLDLGDKAPDFNTWLYTQKYTEAALPQVMDGIVQPFFDQEKTAAEQLVLPGENVEDAKLRIARGIAALFGRQYSQGTVTENRKSDTNIIVNSGATTTNKPYYERINQQRDSIISGTKDALDKINKANQQGQQRVGALQGAVKNIFRGISDQGEITKEYIGFEPVNVKPYNFKVQPSLLGEYMVYDEKTKSFRNSNPTDFGLDETNFSTRAAGGSLVGQEIVLMTPDGKLVPWDSKDVPTGSELFVKQKITIEYEPKSSGIQTVPGKSKTVYSIGPITQNFKVADDVLQAKTLQESTKSAGQPFTFGQ